MTFHVYIYGNSVGVVDVFRLLNGFYEMTWDKEALTAVDNLKIHDACCVVIFELYRGGSTYATFGDGIGELRVV